ncbi:MAG: hypothetical protein OEZ06_06940 [Myxococcales bacterium]|nr:hypothetical protein [Myxococcales bacterium]
MRDPKGLSRLVSTKRRLKKMRQLEAAAALVDLHMAREELEGARVDRLRLGRELAVAAPAAAVDVGLRASLAEMARGSLARAAEHLVRCEQEQTLRVEAVRHIDRELRSFEHLRDQALQERRQSQQRAEQRENDDLAQRGGPR